MNLRFIAYLINPALFNNLSQTSLNSQKSFISSPGRVTIKISFPFFIAGRFSSIIFLNTLFILFLTVAFFDTFWETTKPKRESSKSFLAVLRVRKSSLNPFPFLKTLSKSFFFFNRLFCGSMKKNYTVNCRLFFFLLLFKVRLPPLVAFLFLKPWVFFLFFFFLWYVMDISKHFFIISKKMVWVNEPPGLISTNFPQIINSCRLFCFILLPLTLWYNAQWY